jgi:hypothetical protein
MRDGIVHLVESLSSDEKVSEMFYCFLSLNQFERNLLTGDALA